MELIAKALGPLRKRLVLVGGCAAGLLFTDPAAAPARVTYDVDLLAEVAALAGYHQLEKEFSRLGSHAICRQMRQFVVGVWGSLRLI